MHKILVIGGTGMLGKPVATRLAGDGFDVTVMSTQPEKAAANLGNHIRVVDGDVRRPETLTAALTASDAVYISLNAEGDPEKLRSIEVEGTAAVVRVARDCGVRRLMMISSSNIGEGQPRSAYSDAKLTAERSLIDSGIPFTIFRASWFFDALPMMIEKGGGRLLGHQKLPLGWLAASDYARQVAAALRTDSAANQLFYCLGPEKMTMLDAARRYCVLRAPQVKPQEVPFWQAKMAAALPGMEILRHIIPFFEYMEKAHEDVDPRPANALLGPNTTTLEEWASTLPPA